MRTRCSTQEYVAHNYILHKVSTKVGKRLPACGQCLRFWNTLYMFKVDLLWVWSVWGVSIIQPTATVTLSPAPTRKSTHRSQRQISGWIGILMTGRHCWTCWIALYMYKEDLLWVWSVWGVSIIRTNWDPLPIPTTSTLKTSESKYQGVAASSWPVATVEGDELHYICIEKTCYEYEVCGGSQS